MSALYPLRIKAYLQRAERATTSFQRGRYYENLLVYLIEGVPGCEVERNTLNHYGTEEVDITVSNLRTPGGFGLLPEMFLVECKNWSAPVDSTTLGYFVNVLADRGCDLGILAAARGITGSKDHRDRAYALGASALVRKIRVLVVTDDDLRKLTKPADFVDLLHRRNRQLTADGTIRIDDP